MASSHPSPWPRDGNGKPVRRVRVAGDQNRNLYWRRDGRLEIGYRDSGGTQRWAGPFDTITAARAERDSILGAKGKGERVQPNPRLMFGDALDRWLAEQVVELRRLDARELQEPRGDTPAPAVGTPAHGSHRSDRRGSTRARAPRARPC